MIILTATGYCRVRQRLPCHPTALISSPELGVIDVADKGFRLCRRRVISSASLM